MASNNCSSSQPQQKSNNDDVYEGKKLAVDECIKQLNEFTNSLNEVCHRANSLALSMQSLENVISPEVIGSSMHFRAPKNIFDSTGHLCEIVHTMRK